MVVVPAGLDDHTDVVQLREGERRGNVRGGLHCDAIRWDVTEHTGLHNQATRKGRAACSECVSERDRKAKTEETEWTTQGT